MPVMQRNAEHVLGPRRTQRDDCILCPPCLKKVNKATDRENRYEKQAMSWNEPEQVKAYQTLFENPAWEEEAWQACKAKLARPPLPFLLE